jgi:hypothetical protein
MACHLQIDVGPVPVTDPAFHFGADPDPDCYLMRMRTPITKMMRIDPDPDPLHWLEILFINA